MYRMYESMKTWYFNLPWYWKILGVLALALVALLFVLARISGVKDVDSKALQEIDRLHSKGVTDELERLENEESEITRTINVKKKEVAAKINQAGIIDQQALDRREEILKATTLKELDELQDKYGL